MNHSENVQSPSPPILYEYIPINVTNMPATIWSTELDTGIMFNLHIKYLLATWSSLSRCYTIVSCNSLIYFLVHEISKLHSFTSQKPVTLEIWPLHSSYLYKLPAIHDSSSAFRIKNPPNILLWRFRSWEKITVYCTVNLILTCTLPIASSMISTQLHSSLHLFWHQQ